MQYQIIFCFWLLTFEKQIASEFNIGMTFILANYCKNNVCLMFCRISYHSKEVYITLGHEVWKKMWAWARKKHVSKTAKEITSKYLIPGKGHKWTWGKSLTETLFNLAEVTTWVMRPLKLDRNPYLL
jgi:hypothetical protein